MNNSPASVMPRWRCAKCGTEWESHRKVRCHKCGGDAKAKTAKRSNERSCYRNAAAQM